jgi:hypothetical protein
MMLLLHRARIKQNLICGLLICALTWGVPARAQESLIYGSDAWLDQRYDWVFYLNPKALPNYLNYPTSGLSPIVNMEVNYRIAPRLNQGNSNNQVHYEDLWYHDARAVGCRKYCKLPFKNEWQGAICVPATADATNHPGAIANAIIRLLLDVNLIKCTLVVVLAPPGQESVICDQLGQFKFFRTDDMSLDNSSSIHLLVSSGDIKDRTFLLYAPKK